MKFEIDEAIALLSILFGKASPQNPAHLEVRSHARNKHDHHPRDDTSEGHDGQRQAVQGEEAESERHMLPRIQGCKTERKDEKYEDAEGPEEAIQTATAPAGAVTSVPTKVTPVVRSSSVSVYSPTRPMSPSKTTTLLRRVRPRT